MTRLTDKEREAVAWVENTPEGRIPVGADIHAAKILASCVTRLDADLSAAEAKIAGMVEAAQAVIDRWETPLWKDATATAEFIYRLRDALIETGGGEDANND